jgi:hypothetical protein
VSSRMLMTIAAVMYSKVESIPLSTSSKAAA